MIHFAAGLALDPRHEFDCDYVGTVPAAKGYGDLRMYLLRRRATGLPSIAHH